MAEINVTFVRAQSDNLPKVTVLMVSDFFAESEEFNIAETRGVKAKSAEGKNYGDSAIGYIELGGNKNLCLVRGKVCPEHRVNNKPYKVSMLVDEKAEQLKFVQCEDCAAGKGGCKHAIAFLMWVHRRSEEPEPTATVCYWNKPQLAQVGANVQNMRVRDLVSKRDVPVLEIPENNNFLNSLLKVMEKDRFNCQLSRQFLNYNVYRDLSMHSLILKFSKTDSIKNADNFLHFASIEIESKPYEEVHKETLNQSESPL